MIAAIYNKLVKFMVCAAVIISNHFALTSADCTVRLEEGVLYYGLAVGLHIEGR